MAEESKQLDPDATVTQPFAGADPEATVTQPLAALDPEATGRDPVFDPDATLNPAEKASLDPEATVRVPSPGRIRNNPFAPKSPPESIQANLSALGGLNALIAIANPILGAVPQIRRALEHPDPAGLRAKLRDQIESLETSAMSAEISDATVATAIYALCVLLDESAAATPWGGTWIDDGLLKEMRGESGGGEGFFARLDQISAGQSPENADHADLLEFFYICLALGFEGRYRNAEGGRQALEQIRNSLYATISGRRPRPEGLSEHWRSATAEAAAAPAREIAAKVSAQVSAQQPAGASEDVTLPPVKPSFLSRVPRRAVWSALAGVVGAMIVFYLLALRLLDDETKSTLASRPGTNARVEQAAPAPAPAPAPLPASAELAKALEGEPVAVTEDAGRIVLALRHERQFAVGGTLPAAELRPVIQKIAAALEKIPGTIVITGHADISPSSSARHASNTELSAARARAVAQLMAPKLSTPGRLAVEGKGDAEPIAPGDTQAARAMNRRVTIILIPAVKPAS